MTYAEAMQKAYGEEQETFLLSPGRGITAPDADEFFGLLKAITNEQDYVDTSDTVYKYHDTFGYGWNAFGTLYIAIPEYDTYERHTGKWATFETLKEAVQQCHHEVWEAEDDREDTIRDTDEFLSRQ